MPETKLRFLESELNTCKETADLLGIPVQRVWLWRRLAANISADDREILENYLTQKLGRWNAVANPAIAFA